MEKLNSESLQFLSGGNDAADCAHFTWGIAAGLSLMGPLGAAAGLAVFMFGTVGCVEYHR